MEDLLRRRLTLFSFASSCLVASTISAIAQEKYLTAIGEEVAPLDVFQDCEVCPEMIVLPLGTFRMGSTVGEANAARLRYFTSRNVDTSRYEEELRQSFERLNIDPDNPEAGLLRYYASEYYDQHEDPQYSVNPMLHEVPSHEVTIDLPIAMGRNEVTREDWAACVEDGGCENGQSVIPVSEYVACEKWRGCIPTPDSRVAFRIQTQPLSQHPLDPRHPRVGVTYYEMQDYVSWLNEKVGALLSRIPTEAEWEYACRAGTQTVFAFGNTLTSKQANFYGKISYGLEVEGEYREKTTPVKSFSPNAWGLYDMHGNLYEWCADWYAEDAEGGIDPDGPAEGDGRIIRGGTWNRMAKSCRSAYRYSSGPESRSYNIGFRVVLKAK